MSICLAGATGLVGSELVRLLGQHPELSFLTLTRKNISLPGNGKSLVIDWDRLEDFSDQLIQDTFICCLGSTIKEAGSQEAFRKVDFDYVIRFAKIAAKNKAKKFLVISAGGANPKSSIFYNRIKGEMEESLRVLDIPQVQIFRPSLLLGKRDSFRPAEFVAQKLLSPFNVLLKGNFEKFQAIESSRVAEALLLAAIKEKPGFFIYESDEIKKMKI